jgi:ribosomal-protein-alanine N-acetyltransferase
MQHIGDGQVWRRERTRQFIQSAIETLRDHGYCQWALIHKADDKLIGYCGFKKTKSEPEIGWRLAPDYWGQGLATEAARAALEHGLMTLRFRRVIATAQTANVASARVIEKLGMTLERRFDRDGRKVMIYARTLDDRQ